MKIYITKSGKRQAGLFSYVMQALHNLSVVDNTDDKLYIKYDEYMLYRDDRLGRNVWDYYFEQPFSFTHEEVISSVRENAIFIEDAGAIPFAFTPRFDQDMLTKGKYITKKHIRVKEHILQKVDLFLSENFDNKSFFAIHRRGTDHYKDNPLIDISKYIEKADQLLEKYETGLICSDEEYIINIFKERYGNAIKSYNSIRCNNDLGVHYSLGLQDPYRMGEDVIIESILMSMSHYLVKTVSGVTSFATLYGNPIVEELDSMLVYS